MGNIALNKHTKQKKILPSHLGMKITINYLALTAWGL